MLSARRYPGLPSWVDDELQAWMVGYRLGNKYEIIDPPPSALGLELPQCLQWAAEREFHIRLSDVLAVEMCKLITAVTCMSNIRPQHFIPQMLRAYIRHNSGGTTS
jgi:hypothetical protein